MFTKYTDPPGINVHTYINWTGVIDDRWSTLGYSTFVGENLITRRSKKQSVVARSSAEAFIGMTLGICEALWLRLLLTDLGYPPKVPIQLYCDDKTARDIAHNSVQYNRAKHVEADRFLIKERLDKNILEFPKILLEEQLADLLTKAITSKIFYKFGSKLGMCDIHAPT